MNLNANSITARIYRYFWANEYYMPDNLCPYFWKLIIALIFYIPLIILSFPMIIIEKLTDDSSALENPFGRMVIGLLLWAVLTCIVLIGICEYHLVKYWLQCFSYDHELAEIAGCLDIIAIILIIFFYFKSKQIDRPEFIDMTAEFIKAKYNKYCPKITWDDENKN